MINSFVNYEPAECRLLDMKTREEKTVVVPGYQLYSWPRWVDEQTIVAVITTGLGKNDEQIVLLDVINPAKAEIKRALWKRVPELDVVPRWPLYRASTGEFLFVGDFAKEYADEGMRGIYVLPPVNLLPSAGAITSAVALEPPARQGRLSWLSLSPDGRYLLFAGSRPAG